MAHKGIDQALFREALRHHQAGRLKEAERLYREVLEGDPRNAAMLHNLGVVVGQIGRTDQAIKLIKKALDLRLRDASAHYNLANLYRQTRQFDLAIDSYRRALKLNPRFFDAQMNLGASLQDNGLLDEALHAIRAAMELRPDHAPLHSNLLYALMFHPGFDGRAILDEHRIWNDRYAEPLRQVAAPHANRHNPEKRLRVGYVSPDFCQQAECFFVVPLLEAHRHENFEIHCYASVKHPDEITERIRKSADHWHSVLSLSDQQLAEKIRSDEIDVLVDLTMHMSGNRALVFARKPAPVQVAWLAYPGTTGMTAMDYRLTDPCMDPSGGDESVYAEKSLRLPDGWCCYHPVTETPPVSELPALKAGYVTFGSFNTAQKVNEGALGLWAQAMVAVPRSRLVMLAPPGEYRERTLAFLRERGVSRGRVEFVPHQLRFEYLCYYQRIDIALDSFPYNGITTTLDSLWMGVPVITRTGMRASARSGLGLVTAAGLPELACSTDEEFVARALQISTELGKLSELRAGLRQTLQSSPLMDAPRFAQNMEAAYRQMWRAWCAQAQSA